MDKFNKYLKHTDFNWIKEMCIKKGELTRYSRNEYFTKTGQITPYIGYVKQGTFRYRCFNPAEQKEYSTGFAFEKEFVADYPACMYQVPSQISIQAITPSEVYLCNAQDILQAFNGEKVLSQARINTEQILFCVYENYLDLYKKTPEERYKDIVDRCPEVLQVLTLKELASYLRITPVTMSKIRKKITFDR